MQIMKKKSRFAQVHPSSIVEEGAQLGKGVTIGPYVLITKDVVLGDHVEVMSHAFITGQTTIGEGTKIWPFACIGTQKQDLESEYALAKVTIGAHCKIREYVTINSGEEGSFVAIGDDCLIMTGCHIAHRCTLGCGVIMSNQVHLAGHVSIEDYARIGGLTGVHQFSRVGCYAMVGGMSRVTHDVPPYTIGGGIPYKFGGINSIGLKRHSFSNKQRKILAQVFKLTYRSGMNLEEVYRTIEAQVEIIDEVRHWVNFCRSSQRGLIGFQTAADKRVGEEFESEALEDFE